MTGTRGAHKHVDECAEVPDPERLRQHRFHRSLPWRPGASHPSLVIAGPRPAEATLYVYGVAGFALALTPQVRAWLRQVIDEVDHDEAGSPSAS